MPARSTRQIHAIQLRSLGAAVSSISRRTARYSCFLLNVERYWMFYSQDGGSVLGQVEQHRGLGRLGGAARSVCVGHRVSDTWDEIKMHNIVIGSIPALYWLLLFSCPVRCYYEHRVQSVCTSLFTHVPHLPSPHLRLTQFICPRHLFPRLHSPLYVYRSLLSPCYLPVSGKRCYKVRCHSEAQLTPLNQ